MRSIVAITATLLCAGTAADENENLVACSKFFGEIAQRQCYETLAAHSKDPHGTLIIMPPRQPTPPEPPTLNQACEAVFNLAKTVMTARQSGAEMPAILEAMEGDDFGMLAVKAAYDVPLYLTEKARTREITEFANSAYSACQSSTE